MNGLFNTLMYLLNTDVLIWILRGKKEIVSAILDLKERGPLGISVISIAEIYKNIFPSELVVTEEFLFQHELLNVDARVAKSAGFYWQQFSQKLKNLSLTDCLIAATAQAHLATLVSLNTKHFPMKDIIIINPLKT